MENYKKVLYVCFSDTLWYIPPTLFDVAFFGSYPSSSVQLRQRQWLPPSLLYVFLLSYICSSILASRGNKQFYPLQYLLHVSFLFTEPLVAYFCILMCTLIKQAAYSVFFNIHKVLTIS